MYAHQFPAKVDRELTELFENKSKSTSSESCICPRDLCTKAKYQQVEPSSTSATGTCTCTNSSECETFLQSASYSKAKAKACTPFLHHYILECNHTGLKYTFEDHDITLIIPEGAVAKGQTIHVEFDVTLCGHFVFPKNTQPISPIVWLCLLEEEARLNKPFQLFLPHFLTGLTTEELQCHQVGFVKATHGSSMEDGRIKYDFNPCDSVHFPSSGNKSYAVLESDHFCFYCLKAKKTSDLVRDASYCLTRVESSVSPERNEIYFIATYQLKTCIKVLNDLHIS
jgi:hypothetical protein